MTIAHLWSWFVSAVWPNLLASILWAGPAFVWHHRRLKRHHADQLQKVKAQHSEDLRKQRIHLLEAIGEVRDQVLDAIGQQQGGDR